MKKLLYLVISVVLLCSILSALSGSVSAKESGINSDSSAVSDYQYAVLDDGTVEITGYDGSKTQLVIPSAIDGYTVSSIGNNAFDNKMLESVTIPNTVKTISDFAFATNRLVDISIPNSVTTLGRFVFYNCSYLTNVSIPNSVTELPMGLFSECTKLDNVTIPDSVTIIGDSAFSSCNSLSSIAIPESVVSIGYCAFCDCTKLLNVTLPESVSTLGENAFLDCTKLESITIKNADCDIYHSIDTIYSDATIIGYNSSTAQTYAQEYSREFVSLDDASEKPTYPQNLLGDVDGDGVISVMDATELQLCIAELIELKSEQINCADTDKDGTISVMDSTAIQLFLADLIEEF